MKNIFLILFAAVAVNSNTFAANLATDNASTVNYPGGTWSSGSNGGSGFGAWTITSSTGGPGGFSGSYIGGTAIGNPAFGIYSGGNNAASVTAFRPFTSGGLLAGQSFSVAIGHTVNINNPGQIGLSLMSGSSARWTLKFVGGGSNWLINDGGSDFGSGQAYAANTLLSLTFTYNGGSSYSYTFGTGSGNNYTATSVISDLNGVQFFSTNQGNDQNMGFNNLNIVPEPSSASLMALGAAGLLALRRRRNA